MIFIKRPMGRYAFGIVVVAAIAAVLLPSCKSGTVPQPQVEQVQFSAEDEQVKRPVPLPAAVKAVLSTDAGVKQILEFENIPADKMPSTWFLTSEVHLNGPEEQDLVVIARGPLSGANVTTYWLFRPRGGQYEMILSAAPAHTLIVSDTLSNGYRDVRLLSSTADHAFELLCKFDGKTYQPAVDTPTKR